MIRNTLCVDEWRFVLDRLESTHERRELIEKIENATRRGEDSDSVTILLTREETDDVEAILAADG